MGPGQPYPGVVVLYNESLNLIKGEPQDMIAEKGVIECATAIAKALTPNYKVVKLPIHTDVELALAPYPPSDWVVFNLGEGIEGRLFEVARIAWALEAMGYTFTGAGGDAIARSTHKGLTKQILASSGIATPEAWIFRDAAEIASDYEFPLIVKPISEDASLGINQNAVVHNVENLRNRVGYINKNYRQAALAERFIVGREFNISVWDNPPELLPLYEIDFSDFANPYERIVSFAAKWETQSFEYNHTPGICPADVAPELELKIVDTVLGAWFALDCKDYTRVDIRVSEEGAPFVIEVNCNPDLSPDAGFFRAARTAGFNYQEMVTKILQMAIVREQNRDVKCLYQSKLPIYSTSQ